jgi:hypothetical protein
MTVLYISAILICSASLSGGREEIPPTEDLLRAANDFLPIDKRFGLLFGETFSSCARNNPSDPVTSSISSLNAKVDTFGALSVFFLIPTVSIFSLSVITCQRRRNKIQIEKVNGKFRFTEMCKYLGNWFKHKKTMKIFPIAFSLHSILNQTSTKQLLVLETSIIIVLLGISASFYWDLQNLLSENEELTEKVIIVIIASLFFDLVLV